MLKNLLTTYDLKSGIKKCPNLLMLCGFEIRSKGYGAHYYYNSEEYDYLSTKLWKCGYR